MGEPQNLREWIASKLWNRRAEKAFGDTRCDYCGEAIPAALGVRESGSAYCDEECVRLGFQSEH